VSERGRIPANVCEAFEAAHRVRRPHHCGRLGARPAVIRAGGGSSDPHCPRWGLRPGRGRSGLHANLCPERWLGHHPGARRPVASAPNAGLSAGARGGGGAAELDPDVGRRPPVGRWVAPNRGSGCSLGGPRLVSWPAWPIPAGTRGSSRRSGAANSGCANGWSPLSCPPSGQPCTAGATRSQPDAQREPPTPEPGRPTDLPRRVGTAQWRVNLPAGSRRMPRRGKR
jgi:hypothetical protein